jgi:hypothetical protein
VGAYPYWHQVGFEIRNPLPMRGGGGFPRFYAGNGVFGVFTPRVLPPCSPPCTPCAPPCAPLVLPPLLGEVGDGGDREGPRRGTRRTHAKERKGEKSASLLPLWSCAPCSWVHEPMGGSPMPRKIYSLVKERAPDVAPSPSLPLSKGDGVSLGMRSVYCQGENGGCLGLVIRGSPGR